MLARFVRRSVLVVVVVFAGPATASAAPTEVLRWYGDTSSATGNALGQGECDVNGDGYDDAIAGAWFWDKAPNNNTGAAYVLFGGPQVSGGDLNTPSASGAVRIDGPATANSFVGFSVACLGDVNGDAIDDLGIGHYTQEKAYVVLGAEDFGSIDLGLLGDRGYELRGDATDALDYNVGYALSSVGDVNDDGLDDIAIAGVVADTQGRTNNGRVWVVAGKEDVANIDLLNPQAGEVLLEIDGRASEDRLGQIAPAGDVNGDDIDDLVLGAYTATPWGSGVAAPGSAYVVFGGGADGNVDLASLGNRGFAVVGPKRQRDRLGVSVDGAGDLNDDGFDDVVVGGDGVYNAATGQRPGSAWVIWGSDSPRTVYTETDPSATAAVYACGGTDAGTGACDAGETQPRGYWIKGADSDPGTGSESTGYSVAGIGDVSGDGVPDLAVGAYGYDPVNPANPSATMAGAGAVWVVNGRSTTATADLATLGSGDGYRIDGLAAGDRFGRQVADLGDVDGNGVEDFAGAGDFAQRPLAPGTPRTQSGEVALALLGPPASSTALAATPAAGVIAGDSIDLTATVGNVRNPTSPPAGGTVAFTLDDIPISGCEAVAVALASAQCVSGPLTAGAHELAAAYSGDASLGASRSETIVVTVGAPADPPTEGPPAEGPPTGDPPTGDPPIEVPAPAAGTGGADKLHGGGGPDELRGRAGSDELFGFDGEDKLFGGDGDDALNGGAGDDEISGGRGDDDLRGGAGDDVLEGGPGRDVIRCGDGEDTVIAGPRDKVGPSCEHV